ncbi:MaoC/PaaZ C-terminal domain-containing protein [Rhizobacter sp. Root404]|uniref:MaoC/PaaZ C-terminal domain-containing protein n=1 Tax=Rhizobacter sp. Root404 TaxID=1736528 RepID=UPI0006FA74DF|nr:MaoC/PaaZ C-terminal domain-containing protein [Rhizobacter sp. Root404]KQW38406.1 hypothetical protein ASC76_10320 [Rhizobacter sp. Root404]
MPTLVYFEDLEVGSVHVGSNCTCDEAEMLDFALKNDPWPFHLDLVAAAQSPFGERIASGGFIVTLWYRSLIEVYNTNHRRWVFLGGFDWKLKFVRPLRAGDSVQARLVVKDKRVSNKPGRGIVTLSTELRSQESEVVCTVEVIVMVSTRGEP